MQGSATFTVKSWDEKPYAEMDGGRKLTRAHVVCTYQGDLEGEGTREYTMAYGADGKGNYVGIEHVVGRIGAKTGSFVMQHTGTFEGHAVNNTWVITHDSGTGELQGVTGSGEGPIAGQGPYPIAFHYSFA